MNNSNIAIALTCFYPNWYRGKLRSIKHTDKVRGDLTLEFIKNAISLGCSVVAVDGKSAKSFRKTLLAISGIHLILRRSIKRSPAKRQAFKKASQIEGIKAIVATEPEKVSLLKTIGTITKPILQNKADIVIPMRNDELFAQTYPKYMYESEIEGNQLYNEQLKANNVIKNAEEFDFFFGPRVFKNEPKILRLFMKKFKLKIVSKGIPFQFLDPEELSNASFFPLILALKKKLKVISVEIPFSYPKLQKENEEIGSREYFVEKRKNQRLGLLLELIHFLPFT